MLVINESVWTYLTNLSTEDSQHPAARAVRLDGDPTVTLSIPNPNPNPTPNLAEEGEDFFVALADHTEWGHAFTVWGEVRDDAGEIYARYRGGIGEV